MMILLNSSTWLAPFLIQNSQCPVRRMVSVCGTTSPTTRFRSRASNVHDTFGERPPDPSTLLNNDEQEQSVQKLVDWWCDKEQVLCLTGAGLSTESGIPDYRGNQGSYHKGHKPMVHDQFMGFEQQRKRYWGRGLVGWKSFDSTSPNDGHYAIAKLEEAGKLGVVYDDQPEFYLPGEDHDDENVTDFLYSTGKRKLALITQNVDTLHRRAGSKHLIELHGRTDRLRCMNCGSTTDRRSFHDELENLNKEWLDLAREQARQEDFRADGDAEVRSGNYEAVRVPACKECSVGFLKPDVVFFGDSVPKGRVEQCRAAVRNADGLLVVGSSLAVHSAFQHVRAADKAGIPIAILNVGTTRAQAEGIKTLSIEAPAGPTLRGFIETLKL